MRGALVAVVAVVLVVAGCGGSKKDKLTAVASGPVDYELGPASATAGGKCPEAVASWTGAAPAAQLVVFVNAKGPTTITLDITTKAGARTTVTAPIAAGNDTHEFDLAAPPVATVSTVQVTATDSPQQRGGTCLAPGSPTN